jgi:hypothetical protein
VWAWRRLRPGFDQASTRRSTQASTESSTQAAAPPQPRLGIRPVAPTHPAASLDSVLAQATALLARARAARDGVEVQRLLQWIDARLDERLRLTRSL